MKAYLMLVAALVLGSILFELHLTEYFKPSVASLQATTETTGRLYFVWQRYADGLIPTVNHIALECHLYFGGSAGKCPDSAAHLVPGTEVTVSVAQVFSTYHLRSMPMSITVKGIQVYAVTPEQVIEDYMRRSRRSLPLFPLILLGVLIVAPLASENFKNALWALFRN